MSSWKDRYAARAIWVITPAIFIAMSGCAKKQPDRNETTKAPHAGTAQAAGSNEKSAAASAASAAPAAPAAPAASANTSKSKVVLWHAYRDAERKALEILLKSWNEKNPSIEVTALAVPFDALIDKAQVAIPRGNGPDLVIFAHDKVGTWARDGLVQPLGTWASQARLSRFLPQTIKPLVFERALYGFPLTFKSLALFYNKAMVPKPPATMAELIREAQKHVDEKEGKFGLAYDAADLYFHAPLLHAHNGGVFDEKRRSLTINSPAAVAAAEAARKLHAEDKILPKGMSSFVITAMFNDGKVPFVLNGPWFISEIESTIKWGVAMLPTASNGQPLRPFLGSEAVMLSAKTKVKDAALRVLDYLTSDEAALTRLSDGKQMVANRRIYENPRWSGDPVIKVFRAQAERAVPMSNAVEAGLAWQPYNNALRKIIFGGKAAAATLAEAQQKADAALAKLKR